MFFSGIKMSVKGKQILILPLKDTTFLLFSLLCSYGKVDKPSKIENTLSLKLFCFWGHILIKTIPAFRKKKRVKLIEFNN